VYSSRLVFGVGFRVGGQINTPVALSPGTDPVPVVTDPGWAPRTA